MKKFIMLVLCVALLCSCTMNSSSSTALIIPESSSSSQVESSEPVAPSSSSEESSSSIPAISISQPVVEESSSVAVESTAPVASVPEAVSSTAAITSSEPAAVIAPTPVSTEFMPTAQNYPVSKYERYVTDQATKDIIYKWYDNCDKISHEADIKFFDVEQDGLTKYYSHNVIMSAVKLLLDNGYNPAVYFGGGTGNALTMFVCHGSGDGVTFNAAYLDTPTDYWAVIRDSDI